MIRRSATKTSPPLRRASAAAGLVVFVAGLLGSWSHDVLVRHEVCAEHGELVEVGARVASEAHERDDRRAARVSPHAGAPEALHGHDHCPLAAHHPAPGVAPSPGRVAGPAASKSAGRIAATRGPVPAIAILSVAPKSSPPV